MQPTQQHVAPCVKVVELGFVTRVIRVVFKMNFLQPIDVNRTFDYMTVFPYRIMFANSIGSYYLQFGARLIARKDRKCLHDYTCRF